MNKTTHRQAIKEVSRLMDKDPDPDTKDGRRLLKLARQIAAYEKKRFPLL